jgi:uncharacterized protein
MLSADEVIGLLGLEPLKIEGGFFAETYRSPEKVVLGSAGERSLSTAIYYLLRRGDVSRLHRLGSDEMFHFYAGDPVEMILLGPRGGEMAVLGSDLTAGMRPQVLVPRGIWQGCALRPEGAWALLGTTVSPGFDYGDFEAADAAVLCRSYPDFAAFIGRLCP